MTTMDIKAASVQQPYMNRVDREEVLCSAAIYCSVARNHERFVTTKKVDIAVHTAASSRIAFAAWLLLVTVICCFT